MSLFPIVAPSGVGARIACNFGQASFAFDVPEAVAPGIYTRPAPVATTFYFSSDKLNPDADDAARPSTPYDARISGNVDVEVEREGSCWAWGGQSVSKRGQLALVNADGGLDDWLTYVVRDGTVVLYSGYEGQRRDEFTLWAISKIDSIETTKELRLLFNLADPIATADQALQKSLYPPSQANAQLAGQPLPVVFGSPLYCEGALLSTNITARNWQLHDTTSIGRALTDITAVYDRGSLFKGPNDSYTAHTVMTAAGGGSFATWAGSPAVPSGWTAITNFGASTDRFVNSLGACRCQSSGQLLTAMFYNAVHCQPGYRYQLTFNVTAVTTAGTLTFRTTNADGSLNDLNVAVSTTGAKTFTLDVKADSVLQIVIGGETRGMLDVTIDNLAVASVQVIDWTLYPSGLSYYGFHLANTPAGRVVANPVNPFNTFEAIAREVLETRVPIPDLVADTTIDGVDFDTAAAIDDETGYTFAAYVTEPVTALAFLGDLCDSVCGWVTTNRVGQIVFGRVTEPSDTPVMTLDSTNLAGPPVVMTDRAEGLTLRIAGRRNNSPHEIGDLVLGLSPSLVAELTSEWTCVRSGTPADSGTVSDAYLHAIGAPAKPTMLQSPANIDAEANSVATKWHLQRQRVEATALLSADDADQLEPGQTVRLVWNRYGLQSGKNFLVVGVRSRFWSRRVDLKLWG